MEEYYKEQGKLEMVEWKQEMVPEGDIDIPIDTMLNKIIEILNRYKE